MALKVVNTESLDAVANAINAKSGTSGALQFPEGFVEAIGAIQAGGGEDLSTVLAEQEELVAELKGLLATKAGIKLESPSSKEVNFYDYDGTLLHSYTVEEAQALTELPELPTQKGLICQGWNYDLETIKAYNRAVDVGATYVTDDGKTRLYIRIGAEGRMTIPFIFAIGSSTTATVDWGDGTPAETHKGYTGTNRTTSHTYANIGDYVISIEVSDGGSMTFNGTSSGGLFGSLPAYNNMLQKIEMGRHTTYINSYAFYGCYSLASIALSDSVVKIDDYAFNVCYSLTSIVIPNSVTSIGNYVLSSCFSLASVVMPNSVKSIGSNAFSGCRPLASIVIPNSITRIDVGLLNNCVSLVSIVIPNGVTYIATSAFNGCKSMAFYDFTACTSVPTLSTTAVFGSIPSDCQIRVPASLVDEWKSATNWATYADQIIGV